MKIAVDCRYLGKSGIGRVCEGILTHLDYAADEYYLIGDAKKLAPFSAAHIVADTSNPFSPKGMFCFPKALNRICDCLIVPNFIIPFGVRIPVYSVMHDLIFLDLPAIMTRGRTDYLIKKTLLARCMKKSRRIACVSEFTRSRCEHFFPKFAAKCFVNYNGLSEDVLAFDARSAVKTDTLVYVGNVKPHKGLKTLIEAYRMLPKGRYQLKIIGEREGFLTGMTADDLACEGVTFTGRLSDDALLKEIASAVFLVQPSFYEGFGLPPLEALWLGTRPIVSDIPVFREIYGDLPVAFFRTGDAASLRDAVLSADPCVQPDRQKIAEKYSYARFAATLRAVISEGKS